MKVAVHAHMHYADLMDQVAGYLSNIPFPFDLFVTLTNASAKPGVMAVVAEKVPHARVKVLVVANKGRDVKPFYTDVAPLLKGYDIIGHIHGKKSVFNNGASSGWLEYLLHALMGSEEALVRIFERFRFDPKTGIIYPARFFRLPYWANTWLSNRGWASRLRDRLQLSALPESYFSYPVGNMFWARREAILPLLELGLRDEDFPEENGQNDGEIMHALERITAIVAREQGYVNYVIRQENGVDVIEDDRNGVDLSVYHGGSLELLKQHLQNEKIRVVSFDIFDTLVMRPLTDPADLFELMHAEVKKMTGRTVDFRKIRIEADKWQRERLTEGRDVTFEDIYLRVGAVLGLDAVQRSSLMDLELRLESYYMRARSSVVEVLNDAFAQGKRVILTSDMYLDRETVEGLLTGLGIVAYHRLYLSAEIGKRKDARNLFPHILEAEGVRPDEMMHIGDNVHSDLQVAGDVGIQTFHVMSPVELFRQTSLGRTGYPGPAAQLSLFARVSMGLMLTRMYDNPFPNGMKANLHDFGYWYFGPTLLAFVRWVAERGVEDGIDKLYFLARDGDILLRIYDLLRGYLKQPSPVGVYLEVSRRSIGVPFIRHRDQLDKLLKSEYVSGTLSELLRTRLGFELAEHTEINVRTFGFSGIDCAIAIPADLVKVKELCYYIFSRFPEHFQDEKEQALGYLREMGLFDKGHKAVVDIGYSGTIQRILNEAELPEPVHGYYMVLYKVFDSLVQDPRVRAKGLFGDRIDNLSNQLSIDRYSLFYEMVLSSTRGPVTRYQTEDNAVYRPVYAVVSEEERYKLLKLPQIHDGIMHYCHDVLGLLQNTDLIRWDEPEFLLKPFQWFLEHPGTAELDLLAGYSLDDHYCGQGVLYWAPLPAEQVSDIEALSTCKEATFATDGQSAGLDKRLEEDFLWKKYVPQAKLWGGNEVLEEWRGFGGFASRREFEIFHWYQEQYEILPGWFKKIGQFFKIIKGTKRIRVMLEDVGYVRNQATKADEIQAWYNKEYEILPRWYKKFGQFLRVLMGRRSWKTAKDTVSQR